MWGKYDRYNDFYTIVIKGVAGKHCVGNRRKHEDECMCIHVIYF